MPYTDFYVRTTGNDMNGGSSNADAAAYTSTNGNYNGSTTFTPTDGSTPASSVNVGDFASVYNDGATTPVYVARVTAVAAGVNGAITLDTTAVSGTAPTSSATGRSISVGGAWKGPNGTTFHPFNFITNALKDATGNTPRVNFVATATYSITAGITHANAGPIVFQGCTTSAGDLGKATIDGGTTGTSFVLLTLSAGGAQSVFRDLIFQNNGNSGTSTGVSTAGPRSEFDRCVFNSVRGSGVSAAAVTLFNECEACACNQSAGTNAGFVASTSPSAFTNCVSHDNTGGNGSGFRVTVSGCVFTGCVADTNGANGFTLGAASLLTTLSGCVAYNNTSAGIQCSSGSNSVRVVNCVLSQNGTYGIDINGATSIADLDNCAFYLNTSGQTNNAIAPQAEGTITLSGDPFVDAANGDFRLNNTAGAGAACRGTGRGTFTETAASYAGTLGFPDVGAAQHQDAGGAAAAGSVVSPVNMVIGA